MADLKWKIDIAAPQGEVKKAEAAVKGLEGHLHQTGEAATKAMGPLQRMGRALLLQAEGFHTIGMAAHEARAKTGEFLEFLGAEAALEVLKSIAEKMIEIGEEAVKSAAKAERINRAFKIQQGGEQAGKEARSWIEAFSKTSEFTEAENEHAFLGLRKQGVGNQQAGLIMKAAADVAAGSDDREGSYQAAIDAFERLQQTGRVQARTLRPLGIGIEDFKKMPEFKGMSNEKVNAALAKKDVNQNELFQLIMAHAGETKIGTRSADNVDLLATKLTKLQELPERFFKKLGDTKAVETLAHALDGVLTKLDPDSPAGAKIFGGLETAFTSVAGLIDEIDFGAVADGIGKMATEVGPAIELFKELGHDMGVVFGWIGKITDALVDFVPGLKALSNTLSDRMAKRAGLETAPVLTDRMKGFDYTAAKAALHARGGAQAAIEGPEEAPRGELSSLNASNYGGDGTDQHRTRAGVVMGSTHHVRHTTVHVTVAPATVHVGGGKDGEEQGKKAANAYSKHLRKDLVSVVEQANASGGM